MYDRALKLIRQYHRLSQVELAQGLGLSNSFVSELESGAKKPSVEILERYAAFFDIPISSLLLFAEQTSRKDLADRTRLYAADKVLNMLEWLEQTTAPRKKATRK